MFTHILSFDGSGKKKADTDLQFWCNGDIPNIIPLVRYIFELSCFRGRFFTLSIRERKKFKMFKMKKVIIAAFIFLVFGGFGSFFLSQRLHERQLQQIRDDIWVWPHYGLRGVRRVVAHCTT